MTTNFFYYVTNILIFFLVSCSGLSGDINISNSFAKTKIRNFYTNENFITIAAGGGMIMVGGDKGTILYNKNNKWQYDNTFKNQLITKISFSNDNFIVSIGSENIYYKKIDATKYQVIKIVPQKWISGFAVNGNEYLIAESGNMIHYSQDLNKWLSVKFTIKDVWLNGALINNGIYLIYGAEYVEHIRGAILSSTNHIDWEMALLENYTGVIKSVAYNKGVYIAVGDKGTILTSKDSINWDTVPFEFKNDLNMIKIVKDKFLIAGSNQTIFVGDSNLNFVPLDIESGTIAFMDLVYDQGRLIISGSHGYIIEVPY